MCAKLYIEDFREQQYSNYQQGLYDNTVELVKCAGCGDEVEISESRLFKMHNVNDGLELDYCVTCIEIYRQENT